MEKISLIEELKVSEEQLSVPVNISGFQQNVDLLFQIWLVWFSGQKIFRVISNILYLSLGGLGMCLLLELWIMDR